MPKHGPNVWVVRRDAAFSILEERTGVYIIPPVPQRTAIRVARAIAQANGSELIVQGRTGKIRFRDSHGSDPFPPRG